MLHVILLEPEIPPNTGNIIRLCANTGAALHLIEPLGFELDDRGLKRAGLDYHEYADISVHATLEECRAEFAIERILAFSTRGKKSFADHRFGRSQALLFGPETRGLPQTILDTLGDENVLRLPMRENSRSLNLSNAVAVAVYEAWRQMGYEGAL